MKKTKTTPLSAQILRVGDSMYINQHIAPRNKPRKNWLAANTLVRIVEISGDRYRVIEERHPSRGLEKIGGWWVAPRMLELFKEVAP